MRSEDKKADVGATGNRDAQKALDRIQSRTARGPYSHLLGEWCVFVDDYSHYQGLVIDKFVLNDDIILHCDPLYQVSKFWNESGEAPPANHSRVSNGPAVIRTSRFKMVSKQLDYWPKGWDD